MCPHNVKVRIKGSWVINNLPMYKSRKSIMWIRNRTNPHNWKPSEIKIICFLQIFSLKTITLKVIKTKTYKLCMFFIYLFWPIFYSPDTNYEFASGSAWRLIQDPNPHYIIRGPTIHVRKSAHKEPKKLDGVAS